MSTEYVPASEGLALCWAKKRGKGVFVRVLLRELDGRDRVTVAEYEARQAEALASAPVPKREPSPKKEARPRAPDLEGGGCVLCWADKRGRGVFERVHVSELKGRDRVTAEEYEARRQEARVAPKPAPAPEPKKRNRRKPPAAPPPVKIGG